MWHIWRLIDKVLVWIYGIKPLLKYASGILAFEKIRYRGLSLILSDGTRICSGAAILVLHLRSEWFMWHEGGDAVNIMLEGLRCVQKELYVLAGQIGQREFAQVEALMCTTFFFNLFARLGFELQELPRNMHTRLSAFYMSRLREIYYPSGRSSRLRHESTLEIKQGWMSRAAFIDRYGTTHIRQNNK